MRYTKAQVQSGETIVVVIIVMILIVIGIIYASNFQTRSFEQTLEEERRQRAQVSIDRLMKATELICIDRTNDCFDKYKIETFSDILQSDDEAREFYRNLYTNIEVSIYYPLQDETFLLFNFSQGGQNIIPTFVPIIVRDDFKQTNTFAIMNVRYRS